MPREKFSSKGESALTDSDLVAVLIGTGIKGRDVLLLSREVFGFIRRKIEARKDFNWPEDVSRLRNIQGMGKVKALKIMAAVELGRRLFSTDGRVETIRCRDDVISQVKYLKSKKQEHVVALYLDARGRLIVKKTVAVGSLNKTIVEPRDIFEMAIRVSAVGVILAHNHPSGDTSPSKVDLEFTGRMKRAGELLGIELVDHVIV